MEAAHGVIDTGRSTKTVASELSIEQSTLRGWVRDERRRLEASDTQGGAPLTPPERAVLIRLRRELAELQWDNAFLGKAAAYFASKPPKQKDLR